MDKIALAKRQELVGVLDALCEQLELTETQQRSAEEKYNAVGKWLNLGGIIMIYDPEVSAQGSIMLGTTVRPVRRTEFDVDLLCKLVKGSRDQGQAWVKKMIGDRLLEHVTYGRMLEDINRGWRLNYAGEFHMDITPAVPNLLCPNGGVLVPDKELSRWKESNPSGFAKWFNSKAALSWRRVVKGAFETEARVQPLPEYGFAKGVLRRAVQIYKRHRDIYFNGKEHAPISIIITTLAAKAYEKAVNERTYESEFDLICDVLELMPDFIEICKENGREYFYLANPTTKGENFAEKWNAKPERAHAFFRWREKAMADVLNIANLEGVDQIGKSLGVMLGENEARQAIEKYGSRKVTLPRSKGELRIDRHLGLGSAGMLVPRNTFFGK
jgi:Second Messenger Oligonucleotide or Dinucleotide Synthetase domain